jgi:sulfatase maturation enzyme AslB (radical SAM superfamily)
MKAEKIFERYLRLKKNYHAYLLWQNNASKSYPQTRKDEYAEYREKWKDTENLGEKADRLLHISIDTMDACNLSCSFCPRTIKKNWSHRRMEDRLFKEIVNEKIGYFKKILWGNAFRTGRNDAPGMLV